jgi:isopenicillin-N N-acyltransferase-like protein
MNILTIPPVELFGSSMERGLQQSKRKSEYKEALTRAFKDRFTSCKDYIDEPLVQTFLEGQWSFTQKHVPEALNELTGIAKGYGFEPGDLFAYLHLGIIEDRIDEEDGCSVFASKNTRVGPTLSKNRDYLGAHQNLQQVFHHRDPSWGKRECLCVGSLGSPGAYSSGMNSDGLAIADTSVGWTRPAIGWQRYFLMTDILTQTNSVKEALDFISRIEHVGGGSIVLADQYGEIAAVELGNGLNNLHVDRGVNGFVAHTNHYVDPVLANFGTRSSSDPMHESSIQRLKKIQTGIGGHAKPLSLAFIAEFMGSHGSSKESLCRHGLDGDSLTISSVIYCCEKRELYYSPGLPCETEWQVYTL